MNRKISASDIYDSALKGIYRQGFKATTMRGIAADIGIEAATIYNYVDSKQELLETMLFSIADKFLEGISNIDSSSYSPIDKIKQFVALNIDLSRSNPYQVSLLVNEWRHLDAEKQKKFVAHRNRYEMIVEKLLREAVDCGVLRDVDLEILKNSILSTVRWLFSWIPENKEKINPVEMEKQILDLILNGISK